MSANSCCSGGVTAPCVWQWQLLPAEVAGALLYLERSSRWSVSTEQLVKVIQPQRHKNNNQKKQLTSGGRQDPLYIRSGSCCLFNGMNSTTPDERRPRREKAVCVNRYRCERAGNGLGEKMRKRSRGEEETERERGTEENRWCEGGGEGGAERRQALSLLCFAGGIGSNRRTMDSVHRGS